MNKQPITSVISSPQFRRLLVAALLTAVCKWANPVAAQDNAAAEKNRTDSANSPTTKAPDDRMPPIGQPSDRIRYVGPDTYILLDSEGHPQPMPGMTYEDFLAAWKKQNQPKLAANQPGFTIEHIEIDGRALGQRAELQLTVTVRLLTDGPADVPLGLVGAILQGQPRFGAAVAGDEGANGHVAASDEHLAYDPDHGGFTASLIGHAGDRRSVTLELIVPLLHDGAETTLPLNCPGSVSSQLTLRINSAVSEVRTSNGTVLDQQSMSDGQTQIKVAGPTGLFRLTWQTLEKDSPAFTTVLNATGAISVNIDGRGVRSDARLTVRGYGGSFDQFRVRLPRGSQLIHQGPDSTEKHESKYRITAEKDPAPGPRDATGSAAAPQVVLVELAEKQQGPVVIDLATEQTGSIEDRAQAIDLTGFEVLGAVRQFGDIALKVADDWQARWNIGPDVRQVDPTEIDSSLQRPDLSAAFQYDRQPWSLNLRVAPRQLRVHVTPSFELECLPEEARLAVRLTYQVFGARAFEFRVDLHGWEMSGDPIESGGLVDQDRVLVTPEGTLVLPLAQASSRRAEVSFSLRRPLTHNTVRLELPLPVPLADSVGTGELIVRPAPDIDLLPDLSNSTGLSMAPTLPVPDASAGDSGAVFRFRSLMPSAVFAADKTNRTREVSTQTVTQIDISHDAAQVDQRIKYVVRYEPVSELVFEAPNDLSRESDGIDILLLPSSASGDTDPDAEGTPLHITPTDDGIESSAEPDTRQLHVMLPQPRIGRFATRLRYRVPRPEGVSGDAVWPLPLVRPLDGRAAAHHVMVRSPVSLAIGLGEDGEGFAWKPAQSHIDSSGLNPGNEFVADTSELYLPLVVRDARSNLPATTVVERVWLQTWISGSLEQDRSSFRLRTTGTQTTIELPPDTSAGEVEVLVDRRPAEVSALAPGRIVVQLAQPNDTENVADAATTTHTLELRFRQPFRNRILTRHRLTPPQIEGTTALSQVYWQIVLPSDEHIVYSPNQLTTASQWQWLGSFWGRRPLKSQAELEQWAGASEQLAPADSQNQYLFTGLLPVASIELVTAPRWLIVLIASAAVLALVTAWLYVPVPRRSWILVAVVLLIVAAAIAYPTAAMLIAQASAIGVVLGALAALLRRLVARPPRWPTAPVATASSQRMLTPRADSIVMPPVMSAASTAPTASLRISDSE